MPAVKSAELPKTSTQNGQHVKCNKPDATRKKPSAPVRLWRVIKSIYYASAPSWQVLKSGALFFFGFFCWSSANLLLSYEPSWNWTYFLMAYGFLLTWYGPLTHLVLVPRLIPWLRHRRWGSWLHRIGNNLTMISLTLFFSAVLVLGLFPPDVMTFDFRAITTSQRVADVDPTLTCTRNTTGLSPTVQCNLEEAQGVGSIVVESGGHRLQAVEHEPFTFTIDEATLTTVVGQRQFQVIVRAPDGRTARRFTRTVSMIR